MKNQVVEHTSLPLGGNLLEEAFDLILNNTDDILFLLDKNFRIILFNEATRTNVKEYLGIDIQKGISILQLTAPSKHDFLKNTYARVLEGTSETTEMEFTLNGEMLYFENHYKPARDKQGTIVGIVASIRNVTEKKRLEKELLFNELEYQRVLNQATVETQEQERMEIGRELHDSVNQVLTTAKLYLDLALSNSVPETKDELIEKSTKNIVRVINEIRQLSQSLMDSSIGDLGLLASIENLIENINLTRKLDVNLNAEMQIDNLLDKNQKFAIYRIIQEALNNVVKHSKASHVGIRFLYTGLCMKIAITDNGIGFDTQIVKKGAGLKNIANRIYLMNGSHTIKTALGNGTKIFIEFPLK